MTCSIGLGIIVLLVRVYTCPWVEHILMFGYVVHSIPSRHIAYLA